MRHGLEDDDWDSALGQVRAMLERVARDRVTLTYGEVSARVEGVDVPPNLTGRMAALLRAIQDEDHAAGRPLLSALVVNAKTGEPGPGFYAGAAEQGYTVGDPTGFWRAQVAAVYDSYRRNPA